MPPSCLCGRSRGDTGCGPYLVLFGDLGAFADLGDQLLLWIEVVVQLGLQLPNLVELQHLCCGVIPVVAHGGAHHRPVLLLDVATVVLVSRPCPGERGLVSLAPV